MSPYWYGPYSDGRARNPSGAKEGTIRVVRGGSWDFFARSVRAAYRNLLGPSDRYDYLGFRFALGQVEPVRAERTGSDTPTRE